MGRLHGIVLVTPDPARQRAFYERQLGLGVARDGDDGVTFALRGASLVLRPAPDGAAAEIRIVLQVKSLDARVEALKAKGVVFEGGIAEAPEGRVAMLRDPDGNPVLLVEPGEPAVTASWPTLSHAIVNSSRFAAVSHFYREALGLRVAEEHDGWIEFDTGAARLAVHDREDAEGLALHQDQRVTFALEDEDLHAWAEELRGRGVTFAAAPMEEDLGVQAEVEDADGWFVVLHGPPPEEPREEELAEEFLDDDDAPQRTEMIRRPGESSGESTKKRLTAAKIARRTSERAAAKSFELPRGRENERGDAPAGPGGFGGPRPSGPGGPPRPGGFGGPRPGGPGGPRPGGFGGPRPGGPGGAPRPGGFGGARPPGPGGPRGPRPSSPGGPRPPGGGPPRGGTGGGDER